MDLTARPEMLQTEFKNGIHRGKILDRCRKKDDIVLLVVQDPGSDIAINEFQFTASVKHPCGLLQFCKINVDTRNLRP